MQPTEVNLDDVQSHFTKWMLWLHERRCSMMLMEFDFDGELLSLAHDSPGRLCTRTRFSQRQSDAFSEAVGVMPEQHSCSVVLRCQGETREMIGEIEGMQFPRVELAFSGPDFWDTWMWMDRVVPLRRAAMQAAEFEAHTAPAMGASSGIRARL